jgi:thioesterase domain-containing protein/acyl carrier protein
VANFGHPAGSWTPPRDEIENQLQSIWAQVLGTDPVGIGIHQDYFELGGDSLRAGHLFARIEKVFGVRLAVSTLLEARTIEALADVIRGQAPLRKRRSLIFVQPSGSRPPLFCVHTHTGNVLFCRSFPKYMGADQPVYGLQSQGSSGGPSHFSVDQMASHYIEELKTVRPAGPYHLFGYSFGGLVAFEIAHQLSMRGERISFLGMFNTPAPGSLKRWPLGQSSYLQRRIRNELQKLQGLDAGERASHVLHNGWNFSRMVMRSVKTDAWRLSARILKRETAEHLAEQMLDVEHINIAAAKNYQPTGVFPGRITFFLTKQVPYVYSISPEAGWSPLAAAGMEIVDVLEDAASPLEEMFAKTVCDRIRLSSDAGS